MLAITVIRRGWLQWDSEQKRQTNLRRQFLQSHKGATPQWNIPQQEPRFGSATYSTLLPAVELINTNTDKFLGLGPTFKDTI